MKQIMISIKPEWVAKILNGEKTLEIRKTMPKCELPCKVYIYCTKHNNYKDSLYLADDEKYDVDYYVPSDESFILNGKVVAEFILKWVEEFECSSEDHRKIVFDNYSCLSLEQVRNYCNGQTLYGWYINDLIIYDKPKRLSEFERPEIDLNSDASGIGMYSRKKLIRPPQSWCYIEGESK